MRMPSRPGTRFRHFRALFAIVVAAAGGCGGKTTDAGAPDSAPGGLDTGVDSAVPDSPLDVDTLGECEKTAAAISATVHGPYCAALVRLSTIDLSVLGWNVDCGPLKIATEADARVAFAPYAGEYAPVADYSSIGEPGGDYVFHHPPGDFGGLGIVSYSTSKLVFAGALSWSALGSVRYPPTFPPLSAAPSVCPPRAMGKYTVLTPGGGPSDPATVDPVLLAADRTPVKRGLEGAGHAVAHQLVVYFPVDGAPESGAARNEWLVVYDSGLLE